METERTGRKRRASVNLYELDHITQRYDGRLVLNIPRLSLERGRVHALMGPNGAGKSTLLALLAFLRPPASGRLTFGGIPAGGDPSSLLALRRRVVLVDQFPVMFSASVYANVGYGLRARKIPAGRRRQRIMEALDRVGMAEFAARRATGLSGGETRRVAIARAIACAPEALLLDEPAAGVDAARQIQLESLIRELGEERNITFVVATHNRAQAFRISSSHYHLFRGCLQEFPGDNIYPASLVGAGKTWSVRIAGLPDLPLAGPAGGEERILVRIDPDALVPAPRESGTETGISGDVRIPGTVVRVTMGRERVRLLVEAGVPLTARFSLSAFRGSPVYPGDAVELCCPPAALSILPGEDPEAASEQAPASGATERFLS